MVRTRKSTKNISRDLATHKTQAQNVLTEEEVKRTMSNKTLETIIQLCTQQVTRRSPKFAGAGTSNDTVFTQYSRF